MVRDGPSLLYLLLPCSIAGLQPLLDLVELRDSLLAELIALGQQVVQALKFKVLGLLAISDISEPSPLFRQRKVDDDVGDAQLTKRLIN